MKGFVRIGGASLLGIVLILGAFVMSKKEESVPMGAVVVVAAPERTVLETKDEDGNGIADWKEALDEAVFETIKTPPSESALSAESVYEEPTTFTGKFAVAFVEDYLETKSRGFDFSEPTTFVDGAVKAIDQNVRNKKHSRFELSIIPNTEEASHAYGNQLVETFERHRPPEGTGEDVYILQRALMEDDPRALDELVPIGKSYGNLIVDMLNMLVPANVAESHVELINLFETKYADIEAMRLAFNDPLLTLAHISKYMDTEQKILEAIRLITATLTEWGVVYTKEEWGSKLYLFDI